MKNRYFILSVLFWAITSVLFAVTLPSSSYTGDFMLGGDTYETKLGTGSSMMGTPLLAASGVTVDPSVCTEDGVQGDPAQCGMCCYNNFYKECIAQGGTTTECGAQNEACVKSCTSGSSLPLGSPLLLLPFALVYAIVRRKRKEETL